MSGITINGVRHFGLYFCGSGRGIWSVLFGI